MSKARRSLAMLVAALRVVAVLGLIGPGLGALAGSAAAPPIPSRVAAPLPQSAAFRSIEPVDPDRATRAVVARSLQRLEWALSVALERALFADGTRALEGESVDATNSKQESLLRDANRRFDRLSLTYFAGDMEGTRGSLDELTADLLGLSGEQRTAALARFRMRAMAEPSFLDGSRGGMVRIEIHAGTDRGAIDSCCLISGISRMPCVPNAANEAWVEVPPLADGAEPRRWTVIAGSPPERLAVIDLLPRDPKEFDAELAARLEALERRWTHEQAGVSGAIHPQSRAAIRSRVDLLRRILDRHLRTQTVRVQRLIDTLVDTTRLAFEVTAELNALEVGRDPYERSMPSAGAATRALDQWREIDVEGFRMPLRITAPCAGASGAPPLIIAFHGAGGDENMFMEAYGEGILPLLAAQSGAVLVTPRTSPLGPWPGVFDAIVDEMHRCHGVDRRRVFVIGHSLGAAVASSIMSARGDAIGGVSLIAGMARLTGGASPRPPLRIDVGEEDPIVPPAMIERSVRALRDSGIAVDFRRHEGRGHTLVVGEILPSVVQWLMAQPPSARSAGAGQRHAPERGGRDDDAHHQHAPDIGGP